MQDSTPTARPPALRIRGITKSFGPVVANEEVDLDLARGEILALLGENGAGKTTLMSVLFGHYVADRGHIEIADQAGRLRLLEPGSPRAALAAGVGMVHQHFTLAENLSVIDNITLGTEAVWRPWRDRRHAVARLDELMRESGLAVDLDQRVGDLSVGERQRVEILKALYRGARILILDEPTAVLTPAEADQLFATLQRLAGAGLSVIFISHKLGEVLAAADRVAVLRGGRKVAEVAASGADRESLAELMVGRTVQPPIRTPGQVGETLLTLSQVSAPDPRGRTPLVSADLALRAGEIVGIAGVAGNGQSALSALIAGLVSPSSGEIAIAGTEIERFSPRAMMRNGVGRISEDRHQDGMVGNMRLWENLALEGVRRPWAQRLGFLRAGELRRRAHEAIADYDVRCSGPEAEARLLSGGNIQKLILARVLDAGPSIILANQPTRGLDVGAVAFVHRRLLDARDRGAGIILISEDLDELLALCDRVAVLYRGTLTPPRPIEEVTIGGLGRLMAGDGVARTAA